MELELSESIETAPTWTTLKINASHDLSVELAAFLPRLAKDEVRCSRVYGDCYRCNWWRRSSDLAGTGSIRQSRFLRVTKVNGKLVIADLTLGAR